MAAGYYELYQLKPIESNQDIRFRPLRYLHERARPVTIDNYVSMLRGGLQDGENVKKLRERLERKLQDNISIKNKSFTLSRMRNIRKLMWTYVKLLCKDCPVPYGLIKHQDEVRIFKDILYFP